ncbi:hypothetical protein AMATHDRAFT_72815 [Amanita thiersii Skay4041]|uniref:DNA damage-binding protein CMR1 n=1 Tax=Amanita thiersii Skay4041 TaxID=703135 RepID=A0A2A9NUU0_9AGAR|nr:hypothetical protein AMATHDRAFT_72815 [Amanita thiersii Skay4041]
MPKLSQYELEREANIARNRALLEELELKQALEDLGIPKVKPKAAQNKAAKPVQPKRKREHQAEPEAPRRQSARLRNVIDVNESPAKRRKREAELELQRAKEAEERLKAEEHARIAKLPRHQDLRLSILVGEEAAEDADKVASELVNATRKAYPRSIGDPASFDFEDENKDSAAVKELRQRLANMKVISRAKVTQNRIYSCAYHPEVTKDLIFFGDKHGQIGIWDARAPPEESADGDGDISIPENGEGGRYWNLQVHWPATSRSSISCVKFDPINSHNVYTTSYDCTIRCLSFTTGVSREIYATDEALICSMDFNPSGHELWFSDGTGGVTHLDLREEKSKARRYSLSEQKIGCVSLNPTRPYFLLTASKVDTLSEHINIEAWQTLNSCDRIWDVRRLKNIVTDLSDQAPPTPPASSPGGPELNHDPAIEQGPIEFSNEIVADFLQSKQGKSCVRAEWRHDKSVSSAYWDPRGRQIISTSYDDTLRLWDFNTSALESNDRFPSSRPFSRIRHNCQTGKWLTILRAQWTPNPDVYPHFTIGNMEHSLDIFSCKGELITCLLDRQRISAVQAVTASHPSIVERAVSGNASGRCVLWAPADTGYS